MSNLLTTKDVMAKLKLSKATVYRLIDQGSLTPFKIGGALRFDEQDVETFIQKQREAARDRGFAHHLE